MILGAKIALLLSFSHSAADDVFARLADYLRLERLSDISINFAVHNEALRITSIDGVQHQSSIDQRRCVFEIGQRGFIPLTFSFGGTMRHQGAIIIDKDIQIMEPYGRFEKKIKGIRYDYYEPLRELLSGCGDVRQSAVDIQSVMLDVNEKLYHQYLQEFNSEIAHLRSVPAKVAALKKRLERIDMSSESSKLIYVVSSIDIFMDSEHLPRFLKFYEDYSPYSCVSFTVLAIYCYFTNSNKLKLLQLDPSNRLLWQTIEEVILVFMPDFVNYVDVNEVRNLIR